MEIKWIIDRITDGIAVIEYKGRVYEISAELLPEGIKEGSILSVTRNVCAETERASKVKSLKDRLFKIE